MMKKIHLKNFRLSFNRRNRPQSEENETREGGGTPEQQHDGGNSENLSDSERGTKTAPKQPIKGKNTTEIGVTKRKDKQGFFKSLRRKLTTNLHSHKQEKKRESDSTISSDEDSAELRKQKQRAIAKSKHQRGAKAAIRPVERKVHTAHSDETSGSAEDSMELHQMRALRDDLHSTSIGMSSRSGNNCPPPPSHPHPPAVAPPSSARAADAAASENISALTTNQPNVESDERTQIKSPGVRTQPDNPPEQNVAEDGNVLGSNVTATTSQSPPRSVQPTSTVPLPTPVCSDSSHNGRDLYDDVISCFPPCFDHLTGQPQMWSLTKELFKLSSYGWYWGPITRVEAEEKLCNQSDGAFLVRDSSDERYLLSLSFRSYGRTLHTRIEHCNGMFSFYAQPESEGYTSIVDLIEHSMNDSQTGVFCYSRARTPGSPSFPVRLTRPVSRFTQVRSLQYLCRFVIRQYTRFDHIQELPLPNRIKGWLEENQY